MNTGACTKRLPRASQRATRSAVGVGAVVVWSTIHVPGAIASTIGSSTASTDASSASVRCNCATPPTASAGLAKALAPSASSARAFPALRFHTFREWPSSIR